MNILIIDDDIKFSTKLKNDLFMFFCNYEDRTNYSIYSKQDKKIPFMKYQLAFLDIDFKEEGYTGINIAEQINISNPTCYIVFVSSKNNLIHSTLKVQPFFFIRKSNYVDDLSIFFMLFKDKIKKRNMIEVSYLSEKYMINVDDIIWIKAENHSIVLITREGVYNDNRSLKAFLELLDKQKFIQIHRSIIINFDYLVKRTNNSVVLSLSNRETIEFQIGRTYKDEFKKAYKEMLLR